MFNMSNIFCILDLLLLLAIFVLFVLLLFVLLLFVSLLFVLRQPPHCNDTEYANCPLGVHASIC